MPVARIIIALIVLFAVGVFPAEGGTQVERQKRDNEAWKKAAEQRQEHYEKRAREYEADQDYTRAIREYKKVMGVYYYQWPLREMGGSGKFDAGERSERTARYSAALKKVRRHLKGSRHDAAERRIEQLLHKRVDVALDSIEELAKEARKEKQHGVEYARYAQLLKASLSVRDGSADKYAQRARNKLQSIERDALRKLERVEKDLSSEKTRGRAVEAFSEFEEQYGDFDGSTAVRKKYVELTKDPDLKKLKGAVEAAEHLEAADAYYKEKQYGYAYYEYLMVIDQFGNTGEANAARERVGEMERDTDMFLKIHQTSRERYARELLRRANDRMEKADRIAAKRLYTYIATRFADCVAARQAQNSLNRFEE